MQIWRGISLPNDAQPALTAWLDAIAARGVRGDPAGVAAARPAAADDRCIVSALGAAVDPFARIVGPLGLVHVAPGGPSVGTIGIGVSVPERQDASGGGACQRLFPAMADPRMVAGGPLTDDVVKCALERRPGRLPAGAPGRAARPSLREIFPSGVCDWRRPGVGAVARSRPWRSVGGTRLRAPHRLRWTVARSR